MCAQLWCLLSGLVVFLTVCCDVTSAQMACAKIDFNRTSFTEFRECQGKYSPILAIKDYASHPNVKPYRPKSQYFLSNNFNTYSCIESSQLFAIDTNTLIEAAIYLKSIENSYIEIVIYDADRNERIDSLRNDGTTGWMELKGKMTHVIHRARIEITTLMTSQSVLAIEYIYILNSANNAPECSEKPLPPKPNPNPSAPETWWWVILTICLVIILVLITLIGVYCILDSRRSRSHDCANK